jgi:chitinase
MANATVYNDFKNISSYSYDSAKKELVSYDTPKIAALKSKWIMDNKLGGGTFPKCCGPITCK